MIEVVPKKNMICNVSTDRGGGGERQGLAMLKSSSNYLRLVV